MSKENDQGTLNAEFERLRVISGRIARDPGGVGMDVENLPDFFNNVAHLWDAKFAEGCAPLHRATATRVPRTRERVRILDVGCGTGLELEYILERAPNARITATDQAPRMLAELERKYVHQITAHTSRATSAPVSSSTRRRPPCCAYSRIGSRSSPADYEASGTTTSRCPPRRTNACSGRPASPGSKDPG